MLAYISIVYFQASTLSIYRGGELDGICELAK